MPNTLTVTGNTRLTWSLTDGENSKAAERKSGRAISGGTGPGKANFAWSNSFTLTPTGANYSLYGSALDVNAYGVNGYGVCLLAKEMLVEVSTGPTGGYVTFSTDHVTGVRVAVGGQLHTIDYQAGTTGTGIYLFSRGPTGTYGVVFSLIGEGYFQAW